ARVVSRGCSDAGPAQPVADAACATNTASAPEATTETGTRSRSESPSHELLRLTRRARRA
ncbi:MAG: hypothetical protein KC593_20450, partial [Myxococcales bacterium]|nr:hypothetical protein [Myxococcales bacterium]